MTQDMKITAPEYRPIPGWPSYRAGNDGTIWSIKARGGNDRRPGRTRSEWRELSQYQNANGYSCVNLFQDGKNHIVPVCYLVLYAFVGPRPEGMEACHYPDASRTNSRLDNLRWDTPSSNQRDRRFHGTVTRLPGEKNPYSRLTERDVREIIRRRFNRESYSSIAAAFNTTAANVNRICLGQSWKHLNIERPGKGIYAQ